MSSHRIGMARAVAATGLLSFAAAGHAATFCVSNVTQFRNALQTAAGNGQDDQILLRTGIYTIDSPLTYDTTESHALTIVGGHYGAPGTGICLRLDRAPSSTVIDGQGASRLLDLDAAPTAAPAFTLRGLTLRNGRSTSSLPVVLVAGERATILVDSTVMEDMTGTPAGAVVTFQTHYGAMTIRNNVFTRIIGGGANGPLNFNHLGSTGTSFLVNNTVAWNASLGDADERTGGIRLGGAASWLLSNNILWGNDGYDLESSHDGIDFTLRHNVIGRYAGTPNAASVGNVSADPRWASATDLRLRGDSPFFDAGDPDPPGGIGEYDAWGRQRLFGNAPDIGAYERQDVIFANGW